MLNIFFLLLFLLSSALAASDGLLVSTAQGPVQGSLLAGGVRQFLGIPYAASTAGSNRFRPPAAAPVRSGTFQATAFGGSCPQDLNALNEAFLTIVGTPTPPTQSEDCLSVNIWAPASGRPTNTAVMIWVHGGAFQFGSVSIFSSAWFRCDKLSNTRVIPVCMSVKAS